MVHLVFIRLEIRVLSVLTGKDSKGTLQSEPWRPTEYSGGEGCPKVYEMMVSTLGFLGERNFL